MKTPQEVFKQTLEALGFANHKPSEMSNSDYWLCTTTAMVTYAEMCCELQKQKCNEKAEIKYIHYPESIDVIIDEDSILSTPNVAKP